jgi:hypothetical protein
MFRSSTIIRELVLSLAKVVLEHSVSYVLVGYVVVWQHVLEWRVCCVLCRMRLTQSQLPEDTPSPKHVGAIFV